MLSGDENLAVGFYFREKVGILCLRHMSNLLLKLNSYVSELVSNCLLPFCTYSTKAKFNEILLLIYYNYNLGNVIVMMDVHYMQKYTGTLKPVYFGTCVISLTVFSDADSFSSFFHFLCVCIV